MSRSLFQRCGGFAAVNKVVMDFYDRMLDSEKAGDFFEDVDMPKLIDHQTKFISSLLGGPASFTDEQLRRAHKGLEIDEESFKEMVEILCATLADHGFESSDVAAIRSEMETRKNLVVMV
ncbi:group 1 truncated hemoglobin [Magnetospira sp. QH-2]|uniref:group I truncated hemoglobin n=1 Tax=Magnetospira sp. (strain QH-2) TaxID=1288970 RepID=UPI0003E811AE|nr:group 1 truncated hemoglobin [Magnetospira sp. QH-2]CCQ73441.1 Protozoan/cyanobacterial globin family protein [Magnetospira sp. QH-2]